MMDGIPNWLLYICQKDIVEVMGEFPKTMGAERLNQEDVIAFLNRCILLVLLVPLLFCRH